MKNITSATLATLLMASFATFAQTTTPASPTTAPTTPTSVPPTQTTPTSPTTTPASPQVEPQYKPQTELNSSPRLPQTGNPSEDTLIRGQRRSGMKNSDMLTDSTNNRKGKTPKMKKRGTSEDTTSRGNRRNRNN